MKAFHFLNWNLRVKSAIQKEKEESERVQEVQEEAVPRDESSIFKKARKRSATPSGNDNDVAPKSAKKESGELGQNSLRSLFSGKSCKPGDSKAHDTTTTIDPAIQEDQEVLQDQSSIPEKARKLSTTPPGSDNDVAPKSTKKGNESGGKLFRSSLKGFFSRGPKESDKKDQDSVSKVSQQDAGPAVHYGLDQNIASKINTQEATCSFPEYKQPLLDCLLDGTVKMNASNIIDEKDLEAVLGGKTRDEDNYLNNFVIDAYLNLVTKNVSTKIKAESLEWEKFEKGIGNRPVKKVLKGKASLLTQDVVLVPCNPAQMSIGFSSLCYLRKRRL